MYTRILGHFEMPQSHRWIETQECWYCEKHSYTLMICSKTICDKHYIKPRTKDRCKIQKRIENVKQTQKENFEKLKKNHENKECSCKGEHVNCFVENPGSDVDEFYYDADEDEDATKR